MTVNKDKAIKFIIKEFEKLSNLILAQLDILNEILSTYTNSVPDEIFQKLTENEKEIDKYEIDLDEQIIKAIVLYKPVASDLRQLFAVYRMVINLERVGDLVIKIVNFINEIKDTKVFKKSSPVLQPMLKLTSKMIKRSLLSFTNNDKEYALWTIKKDQVIDDLNHKLLKKSIIKGDMPKEFQIQLLSLADIRSIISSIERIGDHATNISEISIYAFSGKDVRHQDVKKI